MFNKIKRWFNRYKPIRTDLVQYKPNTDSELYMKLRNDNNQVLESILNSEPNHTFEDMISLSRLDDIAKREIYETIRRNDARLHKQNEQFSKKIKTIKAM